MPWPGITCLPRTVRVPTEVSPGVRRAGQGGSISPLSAPVGGSVRTVARGCERKQTTPDGPHRACKRGTRVLISSVARPPARNWPSRHGALSYRYPSWRGHGHRLGAGDTASRTALLPIPGPRGATHPKWYRNPQPRSARTTAGSPEGDPAPQNARVADWQSGRESTEHPRLVPLNYLEWRFVGQKSQQADMRRFDLGESPND